MLKVFITNLGKYNEGQLVGKWLQLPTSELDIREALVDVGINGSCEEYFITDTISDLDIHVDQRESLTTLNDVMEEIVKLDRHDLHKLKAIMENEGNSISDICEILDNLDDYMLLPDVLSYYDSGKYLVSQCENVSSFIEPYIDYEAIGRDWEMSDDVNITSFGCVIKC